MSKGEGIFSRMFGACPVAKHTEIDVGAGRQIVFKRHENLIGEDKMKICIECKHHKKCTTVWACGIHHCLLDVTEVADPVTGVVEQDNLLLATKMREEGERCGPEGKLWETKE